MSFAKTAICILMKAKISIGNRIREFFGQLGSLKDAVVPSSFYEARKKISPKLYKRLNIDCVKMFYEKGGQYVKYWQGKLLWAVDGTTINLPKTEETEAFYTPQTNQSTIVRIQATGSVLYDILNEIAIDAELDEKQAEKNFVFNHHSLHYTDDVVVIYDRGYADYSLIALHASIDGDFVVRVPISKSFFKVKQFIESDEVDTLVELNAPKSKLEFVQDKNLPTTVMVRLIKLLLPTGDMEILMTSLLDREIYPHDEFLWLYNQRWGIETYFDRLKNLLDLQRFSSGFDLEIQQDFHSLVFTSTLESVVTKEDDALLQEKHLQKQSKYRYRVNKAISYAAISDVIAHLFLDTNRSIEETFDEFRIVFQFAPCSVRPGRSSPRVRSTPSERLWYQRYLKKFFS